MCDVLMVNSLLLAANSAQSYSENTNKTKDFIDFAL